VARPALATSADHSGPTLLVAAVVLLFGAGLPLVAAYTPERERPADLPGPMDIVRDESVVTLVPTVGWWESEKVGAGSTRTLVPDGAGADVELQKADSVGACGLARDRAVAALQAESGGVAGRPQAGVKTADGVAGTRLAVSGTLVDAFVYVACADGAALVATASGPAGSSRGSFLEVDEMLLTVRFR